jgi:dCMP deaminase
MNLQNYDKWDLRFLDLAKFVSNWSKDPSTKVGAVIVDADKRVISMGYNGFPVGINDDDYRLNHRETKYKIILHAESNALLFANTNLVGNTLYTYPFMPCPRCAGLIIQAGISKVVSYNNMPDRWSEDFDLSKELFQEAGVSLQLYQGYNNYAEQT